MGEAYDWEQRGGKPFFGRTSSHPAVQRCSATDDKLLPSFAFGRSAVLSHSQ